MGRRGRPVPRAEDLKLLKVRSFSTGYTVCGSVAAALVLLAFTATIVVRFVDQAPSQWVLPDWSLGSKGIFDAASLSNIQAAVLDLDAFADGNAECCLSKPPDAEVLA